MKRIVSLIISLYTITTLYSMKVKFSVDMSGQTISTNGVHVVGDFQTDAGFSGGNWNASSCLMSQENNTDIYSITVNLPAFKKYEYKFVNGDQFYEAEFVPEKSRIGYDFNDNRWIYLDSFNSDTFKTQNIIFGTNAPKDKFMLRLSVNMKGLALSDSGIHVAGTFNQNSYTSSSLCNIYLNTFETILFLDTAQYNYLFINGRSSNGSEEVPEPCAVNSKRQVHLFNDTVINTVCFSACNLCNQASINQTELYSFKLSPNPTNSNIVLSCSENLIGDNLSIFDMMGQKLSSIQILSIQQIIETDNLPKGIYLLKTGNNSNQTTTQILIKD